ncbi:hypothetical protein M405DRAFT_302268 [Rhizopogon salebrosus TDB-379]|nr:hypothetical protein M405DRAFT_302268 [Rhizopogon salebrosus TDB-379]
MFLLTIGEGIFEVKQPPVTLTWVVKTSTTVSLTTSFRNSSTRTRRTSPPTLVLSRRSSGKSILTHSSMPTLLGTPEAQ